MSDQRPFNEEVLSLLECPVCFNYMTPPLFQCEMGHLICETCYPAVNRKCPTCRTDLKDSRNRMMEKVALLIRFPCKYQFKGCEETLMADTKAEHEDSCIYSDHTRCRKGDNCEWVGPSSLLGEHLRTNHGESITLRRTGKFTLKANFNNNSNWTHFFTFDSTLFEIDIEKSVLDQSIIIDNEYFTTFFAHIQKIGGKNRCKDYGYRVNIESADVKYEGIVTCKQRDISELAFKNECLHFSRKENSNGDTSLELEIQVVQIS